MSAKRDTYLAIKKELESKTRLRHVRLFNNQFDRMEQEDTFLFPCLFVEFNELEWVQKSRGLQEANALLRLHVGFESLETEELDVFDLIDEIQLVLQDFSGECFTAMSRESETQDTDHDNVMVWIMDYATRITDEAGLRRNKLVRTSLNGINIEVCETSEFTKPRLKAKNP